VESGARRFEERSSASAWLAETFGAWERSLTDAERGALSAYKLDDGEPLNEVLRRDLDATDDQVEMVRQLDRSLARFRLPEPVVVYRGTGGVGLRSLTAGAEFIDFAYTSTSLLRIVAEEFVQAIGPERREVAEVVIPGGALVAAYAGAPDLVTPLGELEILLPRASRFHIVRQGQLIEMEVVL